MNPLLPHPATRAINHVLRSAPLALERLRKHAGRTAAFHVGPATLAFTVQTTGEIEPAVTGAARDLDVRISPFLLPRLALREDAAFDQIEMQGDADFAAEVRYLARNLTWDVEEDLSKVVGDIAARRMVSSAQAVRDWSIDASTRIAQGAAEYWTEEAPLVASRARLESFAAEVAEMRTRLEALEARIAKLG